MQVNKELFNRSPFNLSPQGIVRFGDGYQNRLIILNGGTLNEEDTGVTRELFNMSLYEKLPFMLGDPNMTDTLNWVMSPDKREQLFEAMLPDTHVMMYMQAPTGMSIGFLAMTVDHRILMQFVLPAFRRDRMASSMLECYINRFDVRELRAGTVIGDKVAEAYMRRLGFVREQIGTITTDTEWRWTYPEQK